MKMFWVAASATVLVLAIAFWLGMEFEQSRVTNTVITETEHLNIDSLQNIWLAAHPVQVDTGEVNALRRQLAMKSDEPSPTAIHDTVTIGPHGNTVLGYAIDSTFTVPVLATIAGDEDTSTYFASTNIRTKIIFIPPPDPLFEIKDLSLTPIQFDTKRKTKTIVKNSFVSFLSFRPLLSHGQNIGGGALLDVGDWTAGADFEIGSRPRWLFAHKL